MACEGHSFVKIEGFTEEKVNWDDDDFRFTHKGDYVYAFIMKAKDRKNTVIKSLGDVKVESVELLGRGPVNFTQYDGILVCDLKGELPSEYVNVLKMRILE